MCVFDVLSYACLCVACYHVCESVMCYHVRACAACVSCLSVCDGLLHVSVLGVVL